MTQIQAFRVSHTVKGQSWKSKSIYVKAGSQEDAINKYKEQQTACPDAIITAEPVEIFPTSEKITVDSYPYGRLRTTAFFSIEFKKGKGFRQVFQTINPKNGRLNAPKNSTYSPALFLYKAESGHIHSGGHGLNGAEELNTAFHFMADFSEIFTPEQMQYIIGYALMMVKVDAKATIIYGGATWEKIKNFYDPAASNLSKMLKGEAADWKNCMIDKAAIDATKDPNYNPFTVTTYEIRGTRPEAAI